MASFPADRLGASIAPGLAQPAPAAPAWRQRFRLEPWETILVICGLLWIMGTFSGVLSSNSLREGGSREASNSILLIGNTLLYGTGALLMLIRSPKWLPSVLIRSWPLLGLVLLCLVSALWSDSDDTTLRRGVGLLLTFAFALYVVSHFSIERFLVLLCGATLLYIVLGYLAVAVPGQGIARSGPLAGSWQGFTGFKNDFGRILGLLTVFLIVFGAVGMVWWRRIWWLALPPVLFLLIKSESKTALAVSMGALVLVAVFRFVTQPRWPQSVRFGLDVRIVAAVLFVTVTAFSVLVLVPYVVEALGRDLTLSGRTKLWAWAIPLNAEHPWIGHGYRAFWIDHNTKYFFEFFAWNQDKDLGLTDTNYAGPANGHSGYIDTWLELGWIGVIGLAGFFVSAIVRIGRAFASGAFVTGYALAAIIGYLLIFSVTERVILQQSEGVWFLTMLFYLYGDPLLTRAAGVAKPVEPRSLLPAGLRPATRA